MDKRWQDYTKEEVRQRGDINPLWLELDKKYPNATQEDITYLVNAYEMSGKTAGGEAEKQLAQELQEKEK